MAPPFPFIFAQVPDVRDADISDAPSLSFSRASVTRGTARTHSMPARGSVSAAPLAGVQDDFARSLQ